MNLKRPINLKQPTKTRAQCPGGVESPPLLFTMGRKRRSAKVPAALKKKLAMAERNSTIVRKVKIILPLASSVWDACQKVAKGMKLRVGVVHGVYKRFIKRGGEKGKAHGNSVFTEAQELQLCAMLDAFSMVNRGLTMSFFLQHVKRLRPKDPGWNPRGWFAKFMLRHRERVSMATVKSLGYERISPTTVGDVEEWIKWFPAWVAANGLSWKWIINADETRVTIEGEQNRGKVIEGKGKRKKSKKKAHRGKLATYIPFTVSTGEVIMDVFVLPMEMLSDTRGEYAFHLKISSKGRRPWPTYYCFFTETGWLNGETWIPILEKLTKRMQLVALPGLTPSSSWTGPPADP